MECTSITLIMGEDKKTEGKKANALLLVGDYLWIAEGNQVRVINLSTRFLFAWRTLAHNKCRK